MTKNRKSVIFKTENYNLYIMRQKNYFIIILALSAMVMSLSSCGSLGNYIGSGTLAGVASDYLIGATGQRGGLIGNMIEGAAGSWYDDTSRTTITVTARPNWYTVTDRNGVSNAYYLEPLNEAVKCLPGGAALQVLSASSCRPTFRKRDERLGWLIPTNKGIYQIINGKYAKIE